MYGLFDAVLVQEPQLDEDEGEPSINPFAIYACTVVDCSDAGAYFIVVVVPSKTLVIAALTTNKSANEHIIVF